VPWSCCWPLWPRSAAGAEYERYLEAHLTPPEDSAASQEQGLSVAPVGAAIGQMDKVTQQHAAWVEESASAAQSLKALAQQLVLSFSVFRMSGDAIDR
jgi:hypothetical protein